LAVPERVTTTLALVSDPVAVARHISMRGDVIVATDVNAVVVPLEDNTIDETDRLLPFRSTHTTPCPALTADRPVNVYDVVPAKMPPTAIDGDWVTETCAAAGTADSSTSARAIRRCFITEPS
jgi:hypothetical protein